MGSRNDQRRQSYLDDTDYGFQPQSSQSTSYQNPYSTEYNPNDRSHPAFVPMKEHDGLDPNNYQQHPHRSESELSYPASSHSGVTAMDSGDYAQAQQYQNQHYANSQQYPSHQQQHPYGDTRPQSMGGLSYVDEGGEYYRSSSARPASSHMMGYQQGNGSQEGLVLPGSHEPKPKGYGGLDMIDNIESVPVFAGGRSYAEPTPYTNWERFMGSFGLGPMSSVSLEQKIENKRRNIGRQKYPYFTWILVVILCAVMIYEFVKNHALTGSVIAIKPTFNWMIGPQSSVLINIGARFVPCMKSLSTVPLTTYVACFNNTASTIPLADACRVADYCDLDLTATPHQTYRFFTPMFLHAGLIHLALNCLVLMSAGAQVERELGTFFYMVVYFAGGVYGFILGGNFALPGVPSVGASGGIFAVNAVTMIDLGLHWKFEDRPKMKLFFVILELVLMVGMGYIPYLIDNFAHIGGLVMGLLLGIILYPSISTMKTHRTVVWVLRVIAVPLIILAYAMTTINFFKDDSNAACEWCRYLSCLPVSQTNYCKGTGLGTVTTTSSSTARRYFEL